MNTDVQHYICIRGCTCCLTVTQRVSPWVSELVCSGMAGSSRTRCGTCRINLIQQEVTKGVIRSRKSNKDRQHNGQKESTNNDIQNTTQKIIDRATRKQEDIELTILVQNANPTITKVTHNYMH